MNALSGHELRVENRKTTIPAYGNSYQEVQRPWLVCSCGGYESRLDDAARSTDERLKRLEHLMEVLRGS